MCRDYAKFRIFEIPSVDSKVCTEVSFTSNYVLDLIMY